MRKIEGKKGQLEISFGMIFSILIIIATVAVAFYVIKYFFGLNECSQVSSFYQDLQSDVDKAWASSLSNGVSSGKLPLSVSYVCFANPKKPYLGKTFSLQYNELKDKIGSLGVDENKNVYLYPGTSCSGMEYNNIKNIKIDDFFCVQVSQGEVRIKVSKGVNDALVNVGAP